MQRLTFVTSVAWFIPGAILTQFLLAGLSLFHDTQLWAVHAILGSALALPIGGIALEAIVSSFAPRLRVWALFQVGVYVGQVALIIVDQSTGIAVLQALHVFNGSTFLLLAAQRTSAHDAEADQALTSQ